MIKIPALSKQYLIIVLTIILLSTTLILCGCRGDNSNNTSNTTASNHSTETKKPNAENKKNKELYIGDMIDTADIPKEDIGDIAVVAKENKKQNITIDKTRLITIRNNDEAYLYFEVEKNKNIQVDVYIDNKYMGETTLTDGLQKLKIENENATIKDHTLFFIGYKNQGEKNIDNISYFRSFNYRVVDNN